MTDRSESPFTFTVLRATHHDERESWIEQWNTSPSREATAHPAYVELFARPADESLCLVGQLASGTVLFPVILRPIAIEPWADNDEPNWDLVTPYGYGGPIAWGNTVGLAAPFSASMDRWVAERDVITAFAGLSLFPEERLSLGGIEELGSPNVVRQLDMTLGELWRDYAHKVRKNVKRARRFDLSVTFDRDGRDLGAFLDVYRSTMDRRGARAGYYFDDEFFERLVHGLPDNFLFCHVRHEHRVVSSELLLLSAQRLYSFLGGTAADAFDLRPNDFLKHSVCEWGIEQGLQAYVLGGGYDGADGIFRYKKSFAPTGEVPFTKWMKTYDEVASRRLLQSREKWERGRDSQWCPRDDYFPAYRA